jgi:predicted nucleotidyltransferase
VKIYAGSNGFQISIKRCSRAKGNFKPGSDIDMVLKGTKIDLHLLNKISLELDDLLLPYIFDVSIYHQISNPDLIAHISLFGKTFYTR